MPVGNRVLVCGGIRDPSTTGTANVQGAYIDLHGNAWLDDRPKGASPADINYWQPLPEACDS